MNLGKKIAEAKYAIVEKYQNDINVWNMFIVGKSTAAVRIMDKNSGIYEQDTLSVMMTLYEKFNEKPELRIDQKLFESLLIEFNTTKNPTYLKNAINVLIFQMNSEKQKTAPFSIDCISLLMALKQNIQLNYEQYKRQELESTFKNYDELLSNSFGQHIL